MTVGRRLYFDVTYTRTQSGNVGITRTVRKMLAALKELQAEEEVTCVPVSFHSKGFRHASNMSVMERPSSGATAGRLYRWLSGGTVRRLAQALMPLAVLEAAWATANRLTFNSLSKKESPVVFQPGDWLLLADESWNYSAWKAVSQARRDGVRAVLVLYDLIPLRQPQFCAPLFVRVFKPWLLNMINSCDFVMCISKATAADVAAFCADHGVSQPPTSYFRLGCDVAPGDVVRLEAAQARPAIADFISQPRPWFAIVGTIEPRKNHALLLDVFKSLWDSGVDAGLLVAGRPHSDSHDLIERMHRHPEQGRRLLTVHDASDEELRAVYSGCRALLFPSLAEGFGLPLVEARARGCIVIASALPALLELADEGVHYFAPDSADELKALILTHLSSDGAEKRRPPKLVTWRDSASQFLSELSVISATGLAGRNRLLA